MGTYLLDQYSLLHFATDVIAYFLGVRLAPWFFAHAIFELSENTPIGITVINKYLWWFWPGGKPRPDSITNMIGDQISSVIGWIVASWLDQYGIKNKWYV